MAVLGTTHSVSTANSGQPAACDKPTGVANGDVLLAIVTVPTLAGTSSIVTPPGGWTLLGHFNAPAAAAIGVTQGWFIKSIPVASSEVATNYTFTATNIGAARVLVQISRMTDRDPATAASGPSTSQSRSTSVATTPTGSISPAGGLWDIVYTGATRSNNTFTAPDTELDDYNPAANTSAAIYTLSDQPDGTYSKTVTASTASSTGLGVIAAFKRYVPVAPPSGASIWDTGTNAYVDVHAAVWISGAYVDVLTDIV